MNTLDIKEKSIDPWSRFFARSIDYSLFGWFVDVIFSGIGIDSDQYYIVFLSWIIYIPIEAIMLTAFATTPGKFLFGLRVRSLYANKITFKIALKRSFLVFLKGEAIGLPIIAFVAIQIAYSRLKETRSTLWDDEMKTEVVRVRKLPW